MISEMPGHPDRMWRLLLIFVVILQLGVFVVVARYRLIDGDEGFYVMASRLVYEHRVPYRDFFFTQMPLLPYVYGLWMQFAGATWISVRALSALFTSMLGTLIYVHVCKVTGKWAFGLASIAIFLSSTHIFAWLPIVKTYALSSLLLFLAYFSIATYASTSPKIAFAFGGLMLGLSADARLYIAGLLPMLICWIFFAPEVRSRRIALVWFLGGFAAAVLPNLYLWAIAPDAYVFGNLGIHAARSSHGLIGLGGKFRILSLLLLSRESGNGFQMAMLFACCGLLIILKHSAATRLAFYLAVTLIVISLLPTPSFTQYFCVPVPFLVVAVVCSVSELMDKARNSRRKHLIMAISAMLLSGFIAASIGDFSRFLSTGAGIKGIRPDLVTNYMLGSVVAMSRRIDEVAAPGEQVMSLWPGYLLQTKVVPLPGFENNTAREHTRTICPEYMSKYHIVPQSQIEAQLAAHIPRLVVVGNQESMHPDFDADLYERMLQRFGYQRIYLIGNSSLWIAPAGPR